MTSPRFFKKKTQRAVPEILVIGWIQEIILPSYIGIIVSHTNDLYQPTQYHGMSLVGVVAVAQMHKWMYIYIFISGQMNGSCISQQFCSAIFGDTCRILPSRSLAAKAPEKLPIAPIGSRIVFQSHHCSGSMLNFGGCTPPKQTLTWQWENPPISRCIYILKIKKNNIFFCDLRLL